MKLRSCFTPLLILWQDVAILCNYGVFIALEASADIELSRQKKSTRGRNEPGFK